MELATRVAQHSDWRLELVALASREDQAVLGPPSTKFDDLLESARSLFGSGQREASIVYLSSLLEELVQDMAAQNGMKTRNQSARSLIRALTFRGVIGESLLHSIDRALTRRNQLVHFALPEQRPTREEVDEIIAVCRQLHSLLELQPTEER
jgi:uncharacterized protein YutE (UPF0331/DUF86 family)